MLTPEIRHALQQWPIPIAVGAGLLTTGLIYLVVRFVFLRKRPEDDADYLERHSILPSKVPRSDSDSDPFSHGSFHERRSFPRRRGALVAVWLALERHLDDPIVGYVVDRSTRGLGVELQEAQDMPAGLVLQIRPTSAAREAPWTKVIVRNFRRKGATCLIGCEFVRPPDSNTMLLFG